MKKIYYTLVALLITPVVASADLVTCNGPNCDLCALFSTANNVIRYLVVLGLVFIAVVIAYAGFMYMTANGDTGKISQAHKMFGKSVAGIVIVLCAYVLIQVLFDILGVDTKFNIFKGGALSC